MDTIIKLTNENKVFSYKTDLIEYAVLPTLEAMTVKHWTLEDINAEYSKLRAERTELSAESAKLLQDLRDFNLSLTDRRERNDAYKEYKDIESQYTSVTYQQTIVDMAMEGIRGAVRYYMGERFNAMCNDAVSKFVGKPAGPKTWDKVQAALTEGMNIPGLRLSIFRGAVHFYNVGALDAELWVVKNMTDSDNKFLDDFTVSMPQDDFHGEYPCNWKLWAEHVMNANNAIQLAFNDFISAQDYLVGTLKIGDVGMNRVYSYDMKERK